MKMGGFRLRIGLNLKKWYTWFILLFIGLFYAMYYLMNQDINLNAILRI